MIARQPACDLEQLSQLLCDKLDMTQQAKLTRHLDRCNYCRQHLDSLTAEDPWCRDMQQTLRELQSDPDTAISPAAQPISGKDDIRAAQRSSDAQALQQGNHWVLSLLKPSEDLRMLGQLDDMPVEAVIGQGGMGVVLKARDSTLQRCLAIKLLSPMLAGTGAARQRFLREARAAAAVVHPNIVPIYAVSPERSLPYLVMPFVSGGNVQQTLDLNGPLSLERSLSIGLQVAEGLTAAHLQGIVHRDIKPANLLLDEGGFRVMITDFGLARALDDATLTGSGLLAGTPQYMSPEQARGAELDHRSDIYSLGAVLYALATAHPPVRGNSTLEILRRIGTESPKSILAINANYPAWYDRLARRLMHPQVDRRVQTAEEATQLLRATLAHARAPLHSPLPEELREASTLTRWKTLAVAMAVAVGLLTVAMVSLTILPGWLQSQPTSNSDGQPSAATSPARSATSSPTAQSVVGSPATSQEAASQTPPDHASIEPWRASDVEQLLFTNAIEIDKLRRELIGTDRPSSPTIPDSTPSP